MRFLSRFFRRRPLLNSSAPAKAARLTLEALEDRTVPSSAKVVPFSQFADGSSTFHRLADALGVATKGGDVVTILPGATPDAGTLNVNTAGITIQGDPNVPASILPVYNLNVNANGVILKRLNLNAVAIGANLANDAVELSSVNTITVTGGSSGAGAIVIDQNAIAGSVSLTGAGAGTPALNNRITNNVFNSLVSAKPIVSATDNSNLVIKNNTITGGGPKAQVGILVSRGTGNQIANNTVNLFGGDANTQAIEVDNSTGAVTTVTVSNNVLASGFGIGLFIQAADDTNMTALVQGNDFHGNAIGVDYLGSASTTISSNLGGTVPGVGQFIGGNNFRGYPATGSLPSASIRLRNVGAGATLSAQFNVFDPSNPGATTFVMGATGTIDTTQPLSAPRSFVENVFNSVLGRTGALSELDFWVNVMNTDPTGQAAVANGILRSDASLRRIVDGYYLKYLGRIADVNGENFWVNMIKGGSTLEGIQAGFISSAEFRANNNSDYIQGLYRTFLGRTGNSGELAFWYNQLQQPNGLATTALGFATSTENRSSFVQSLFRTFLHRSANGSDVSGLVGQTADLLTLEAEVLSSGDYFNHG